MKFIFLLIIFFVGIHHLQGQNVLVSLFSEDELKEANTGIHENYLTEDEKMFVLCLNLVRLHPQKVADDFLVPYLEEHKNLKGNYSASLLRTLRKQKKLSLLIPNQELYFQAKNHAVESGEKGWIGHKGFSTRAKNLKEMIKDLNEANSYGSDNPIDFLFNLLIDQDVPSLGHRNALLNPNLKLIGLHIAPHKRYDQNIVVLLGNPL